MRFIEKILKSKHLETLIKNIHQKYDELLRKIFLKYDLYNELKQGKIFTIIVVALSIILISGIIFLILSPLLSLNLIVTIIQFLLRYVLLYIRWLYTIKKNKGEFIKKYVKALNQGEEIDLELEQELVKENVEEDHNLELINDLMMKINKISSLPLRKEILLKLKEMLDLLKQEAIDREQLLIMFDNVLNDYYYNLVNSNISLTATEVSFDSLPSLESGNIEKQKVLKNS